MGILAAVGREVARTGLPIKWSNIGEFHNALTTRSHAGTCWPGTAHLYVKHDATLCVCVCVCVCVSKCFPWGSRQPNWHWRLARLPGYPGDRYWTASRPHFPTPSFFISFFYTTMSPLSLQTAFPQLSIPCELPSCSQTDRQITPQLLYCPTNALNCTNCRVIKITKV